MTALLIVGIVFTIIGILFTAIGIILYMTVLKEMIIMALMGILFLAIGVAFLIVVISSKNRKKHLIEAGNYIYAKITGVHVNYSVQVGTGSPYYFECTYQDSYGTVHIFRSKDIFFDPTTLFTSDTVKVYVDRDNYKKYYVDVDSVIPKVVRH